MTVTLEITSTASTGNWLRRICQNKKENIKVAMVDSGARDIHYWLSLYLTNDLTHNNNIIVQIGKQTQNQKHLLHLAGDVYTI